METTKTYCLRYISFTNVLSVTILETTKTYVYRLTNAGKFYRSQFWRLQKLVLALDVELARFYRSQFWRLQKQSGLFDDYITSFIGHNFGDYKNSAAQKTFLTLVLSVTILETTKTSTNRVTTICLFYRSQFWRLQKLHFDIDYVNTSFIGHNFGDYKNSMGYQ